MKGRKPASPKVRDLSEGRLRVVDGGAPEAGGAEKTSEDVQHVTENDAPPSWLMNEDAVAEWRRLVPQLKRRKQYIGIFRGELARYCDAYGLYAQARRALEESEMLITRGTGALAPSPYLLIMSRAHDMMSKLAAEMGLNPVSQVRLQGLQLDLFSEAPRATGTDGESTPFGQYRRP